MSTSNLYINPPKEAYKLRESFHLPTADNKTVWAIAFDDRSGQFINSSLSVVFQLIFAWLWGLVAAATIYFAPHRFTRRRLVALVALRNCSDPWSACIAFFSFTADNINCLNKRRRDRRQLPSTRQDTLFGLLLVTIAFAVIVSSIVMGTIGPPLLQVGSVAPVQASLLYSPKDPGKDSATYRAFRGFPAMRALSNVELSGAAIQKKIRFQETRDSQKSPPVYSLAYEYNITGVELGLVDSSDLLLSVKGACRAEYGWLDTENSNQSSLIYNVFNDPQNTFRTSLTNEFLALPPRATFFLSDHTKLKEETNRGNVTYAILATLAHRSSTSEQKEDPWYLTESYQTDDPKNLNSSFTSRIKAGGPALWCWHEDRLSCCGGEVITGSKKLNDGNLAGLAVPEVLRAILYQALMYPPAYRVGVAAGTSALSSFISTFRSIDGIIDAASSSYVQDVKRLVLAGYVFTLNILADTTMPFDPPQGSADMSNNRYYEYGRLREGADAFFVHTSDVRAFNLTGLIAMSCILVFLLFFKLILTIKLTWHTTKESIPTPECDLEGIDPHQELSGPYYPFNKDRWARFKAFSAIHLLRNTYEAGTGIPEDDWKCSEDLPEPGEEKPLLLVHCGKGEISCAGHIATDPELLGVTTSSAASRRRSRSNNNSVSTLGGFQPGERGFGSQEFQQSPPLTTPPAVNSWNSQRYQDNSVQNSIPLLPVHRYSNSSYFERS